MPRINTLGSLVTDLTALGLQAGQTVMVHSALGKVGYSVGGPVVVIRALLQVLTPQGTLVMPAESPSMSDPAHWNDSRVKREWHDVIREHLPVFDPRTTPTTMGAIPEAFRTYPGTQRSNHPLVSVCANGRHAQTITAEHALEFPIIENGERVWVEKPDMAADNGVHFPIVGQQFTEEGHVQRGKVGDAECTLFSTRALVDFAAAYFRDALR